MIGIDVWHGRNIVMKFTSFRRCRKCWNLLQIICYV